MSWRTVVVTGCAKLSYKNRYLVVRSEQITTIHFSEIAEIIVESTMATLTSHLVAELTAAKIKLVFCDERHNPLCETVPYYGAHDTAKKLQNQCKWSADVKAKLWAAIIRRKIENQSALLEKSGCLKSCEILKDYAREVKDGDSSNREGHAAKVYFNALFGKDFCRDACNSVNAALNYGYSILLSALNRIICAKGYATQLGIWHKNEFNEFNLSCDLMEPLRVLVDEKVFANKEREFNGNYRHELIDILNRQVRFGGKVYFLTNFLPLYVTQITAALDDGSCVCALYEYEDNKWAKDI